MYIMKTEVGKEYFGFIEDYPIIYKNNIKGEAWDLRELKWYEFIMYLPQIIIHKITK